MLSQVWEPIKKDTKNAVVYYEVYFFANCFRPFWSQKQVQLDAHWAVLSDTCLSAC